MIRIGLAPFTAAWFGDAGCDVVRLVKEGLAPFCSFLEKHGEVTQSEVITDERAALKAADEFISRSVDVAIVAVPAWSEDGPIVAFVRSMKDVPVWIVDMQSYCNMPQDVLKQDVFFAHTEVVGLLEANAAIRRSCSRKVDLLRWHDSPSDEPDDLANALRAFSAIRAMQGARIGLLEGRTESIKCCAVDELALSKFLGCTLDHLSLDELASAASGVTDKACGAYIDSMQSVIRTPAPTLRSEAATESARLAIALEGMCKARKLDALAFDDLSVRLHERFGLRPCLICRSILSHFPPISWEGDVVAAASMLLLEKISGPPTGVFEPFFLHRDGKSVLFGHAGGCDSRLGQPGESVIETDLEYARSQDRFPGSPSVMVTGAAGTVTMLNLRIDACGGKGMILRGEALPHKRALPGYSEVLVQFANAKTVIQQCLAGDLHQHFVLCRSDVYGVLRALFERLSFPCSLIDHREGKA